MIRPSEAWVLRRRLVGLDRDGDPAAVSEPFRPLVEHLGTVAVDARRGALDGFLCARADRDDLVKALAAADPSGPAPEDAPAPGRGYATLEDIARIVSAQPWLWRGWLASGVLNAVAAEPGTGKTRFAMDLARRLWHGLPWPDGQENPLPAGTRTLWVQGDRNFAEMLQLAHDFGLPQEAVILNGTPEDPTGGLDLDDPETLASLAGRIAETRPGFAVIDTVGMTTGRNLCRPEEAREYFAPLIELAGKTGVAVLGQTHLSKDKEALGRRIVEKARVVVKMTQPDPEGQPNRRRLWVDKSAVLKPQPIGVTMGDSGNDYDFAPPVEPEPATRRPGPPPTKLEECKRWLSERLNPNPTPVQELRDEAEKAGYPAGTLYRAQRELEVAEYTVGRRKWWRLAEAPAVRVVQDAPAF